MIWFALATLAIAAAVVYFRRHKSSDRTHHIITLGGFPVTHVPGAKR